MLIFIIYTVIFVGTLLCWHYIVSPKMTQSGFTALKSVTFGDASAVVANRYASILSVLAIFLIWGAFTGSHYTFIHAPAPFYGDTSFTYTVEDTANGKQSTATVHIKVRDLGEAVTFDDVTSNEALAQDDNIAIVKRRTKAINVTKNDNLSDPKNYNIIAVNGQPITLDNVIDVNNGVVKLTKRGKLSFTPTKGWQMEAIWLPPPENVMSRLVELSNEGYRGHSLSEHLGWSLFRVLGGFVFGALIGIPLGFAMGLSSWVRGWFDPIVEFMRPVPPLALIPLIIIWYGIGEDAKIILLFLAALWIMTIAARSGVSNVKIAKIHAAYSLGASKWVILRNVIFPNALPDIFTGARVAMGVCWGTVVAAELVAAEKGAGQMIMVASKFQLTDIVIMGIVLIGVIGYAIDILMRKIEDILIPWKGKM